MKLVDQEGAWKWNCRKQQKKQQQRETVYLRKIETKTQNLEQI